MTRTQLVNVLIKAGRYMKLGRREVIALTGWSQPTVSNWFTKKNPSLAQYIDWAESLGYEVIIIRKHQKIELPTKPV